MQFAGTDGERLMKKWIHEEFKYISLKREQGISDPEEEKRIRQELQIHEFNGRNSDDWIFQMEDYFHFFQLNEKEKLKVAIIGLCGEALQWFECEHRWLPFNGWQILKVQLVRQFRSTTTQSDYCCGPWFSSEVVHLKSQEVQDPVACGSGSGVSTLPEGFTLNPTGVVCEAGRDGRHGCSGNFDGELGCGFESFAGKHISGGRIGDFGDGFSGGGTGGVNSEFGGEARAVWVDFSTVQSAEVEVFVGNGIGGFFEKGGANSSESGGGSGALTGKAESDGETAASGGLNRDGADFVKGGSAASGSGSGPGCWCRACEQGIAGGHTNLNNEPQGKERVKSGDFSDGFTGGGLLVGGGLLESGLGYFAGGGMNEWWIFGGFRGLTGGVCNEFEGGHSGGEKSGGGLCGWCGGGHGWLAGEKGGEWRRNFHGRCGVGHGGYTQQKRGDFAGGFTGGGGLTGSGARERIQEEWVIGGLLKYAKRAAFGRNAFGRGLTEIFNALGRKPIIQDGVSKGKLVNGQLVLRAYMERKELQANPIQFDEAMQIIGPTYPSCFGLVNSRPIHPTSAMKPNSYNLIHSSQISHPSSTLTDHCCRRESSADYYPP